MPLPPRRTTAAVLTTAALAAVLVLPTSLSSPAGAEPTTRRAGADSVAIVNATFRSGTSRWRTTSKDDRLGVTRGHDDANAVVVRTTADQRAVLQHVDAVVGASSPGAVYYASAWVRSPATGSSLQLRLRPAGAAAHGVGAPGAADVTGRRRAGTVVVANPRTWYRLDYTYVAPAAAPLVLEVAGRGLGRKAPRFVVDQVSLDVAEPSAAGTPAPLLPQVTATASATSTPTPTPTSAPTPPPTSAPSPTPTPQPDSGSPAPTTPGSWMSGASGTGVANGAFGTWRGASVPIAGTWNDSAAVQPDQWTLRPGFEYGRWQGDLDVAVGGIYKDRGDSWKAAAAGAYDSRWRTMLTNITTAWGSRPGTLYLRFAHEFNGDWYPWSVTPSEVGDFRTAWTRFRALQRALAPRTKLVFSPNSDTTTAGLDWRTAFPGADQVDVVSVDYYNQYPFVGTVADFDRSILSTDPTGAPRGLERFRQFAEQQGLPFAISEWSSNADMGDSPAFVTSLHRWLDEHGGTAAGQVIYEIQFNVDWGNGQFQFFPSTRQSDASAAYRQLW